MVRQTLLNLLIVLAPLTSSWESYLLYPLLLLLEAYLILDLTFSPSSSFSSSISPLDLFFKAANDLDLLLFLNLS
jgi:hypothetical protein